MPSPESKRRANKAYVERQKKQHRCPSCGKETDHYYCDYHRAKNNGYSMKVRKERKEEGRCSRCSAPLNSDIDAGKSVCINCRDRLYFL